MTSAYHTRCDLPHNACTSNAARPTWILAASIASSSLGFIDGSIVNVALPALGHDLRGSAAALQWTINGYLLPLSALLLLGGAAGDNFGRRRLLTIGIVVFALASLGCSMASNFETLIVMRCLQGVGASMVMPNSLALLGAAFTGEARGRAIGTWAAAGVGFSAIGPPLGGWLILVSGWRLIFLINVPIALVALALVRRYVPDSDDRKRALDVPGALLATLALGLVTWAVTLGSSHRLAASGRFALLAGFVAFAFFVVVEHRRGERAMMPLTMFESRTFAGVTVVTFLIYAALGGLFVLFPYVLIEGGYTSLQAGLALLPFSLIVGAVSRPMGHLAAHSGPRWLLVGGALISSIGYALLARVDPAGSYWTTVVPGAAIVALGMAGAVAPLTTAVLTSVSPSQAGAASGFNSAVARTGGLIATGFAGAVLAQKGDALLTAFHAAAFVGSSLALVSAIAAYIAWNDTATTR